MGDVRNVKNKIEKKEFNWSDYSKVIGFYRSSLNLSQSKLAERLGVTPTAVRYWENGIKEPKISNFVNLAQVFGLSETELLHPSAKVQKKIDKMNAKAP